MHDNMPVHLFLSIGLDTQRALLLRKWMSLTSGKFFFNYSFDYTLSSVFWDFYSSNTSSPVILRCKICSHWSAWSEGGSLVIKFFIFPSPHFQASSRALSATPWVSNCSAFPAELFCSVFLAGLYLIFLKPLYYYLIMV